MKTRAAISGECDRLGRSSWRLADWSSARQNPTNDSREGQDVFGGTPKTAGETPALPSRRSEAGFTMAEIAIALGVIAFALIAIIGILPAGLQVQRDNREETIINQDARLILEAIKSGGRDATSDLGSFVVGIDGDGIDYSAKSPPGIPTTNLVQLLSDPSMTHTTILSAISGGVASRRSDLGFRYQVVNDVMDPLERTNRFGGTNLFGGAGEFRSPVLTNQIHDVRLRFAWPLRPDPNPLKPNNFILGPEANRYVARALITGWHTNGVMHGQQYFNPEP